MTTTTIKQNLNKMNLPDIYSMMLFILYKVKDIPEYAVLSELCYLLDGTNMTRLLTYFEGKTITIPTKEEFSILSNALLLYQYVNLDGKSFADAMSELKDLNQKQKEKVTDLYVSIIPIINNYNVKRDGVFKNGRE